MKALQAAKLLKTAPNSTINYSNAVPHYTEAQALGCVLASVAWHKRELGAKVELSPYLERRVHQVVQNLKAPRYAKT